MSPVEFLQSWYQAQANGEWEHARGITIETLETPGWMVTIDLAGTALESRAMSAVREERSPGDWLLCEVDHDQFRGQGDSQKLIAILDVFQRWARSATS